MAFNFELPRLFNKKKEESKPQTQEVPVRQPLRIKETLIQEQSEPKKFRREITDLLATLKNPAQLRVDTGDFIGIAVDGYKEEGEPESDLDKLIAFFAAKDYEIGEETANIDGKVNWTEDGRPGSWRFVLRFPLKKEHSFPTNKTGAAA